VHTAHDLFTSIDMDVDAFAKRARKEPLATGKKARTSTVETRDDLTIQKRQIIRGPVTEMRPTTVPLSASTLVRRSTATSSLSAVGAGRAAARRCRLATLPTASSRPISHATLRR
jgi:hypothetical protein